MKRGAGVWIGALALVAVSAVAERSANARALFMINNLDPPGMGFNETTPVAPVGGNSGTTLGAQRMIAFKFATEIWGKALDSAVPIVIDAHFEPLACGAIIALGNARSATLVPLNNGVVGAPGSIYYPQALADRIVGTDLDPGEADIIATFNGDIASCDPSGQTDWYYGLDGKAGSLSDLVEVVLHEVGHGLGFASGVDMTSGGFQNGIIDTFSTHIYDNAVQRSWSAMSDSQRLASLKNVRHLVWVGDHVMKATPAALTTGAPRLVTQPSVAGLSGNLGELTFGLLPAAGLTGPLVVGDPVDGCNALPDHPGAIFLLTHLPYPNPDCSPLNRAFFADDAGGVAILLSDANAFAPPSSVEVPDEFLLIVPATIPGLAITEADLEILAGSAGQNVTVTISPQSGRMVGADDAGRPYLYASDPIRPGSSVSHWDTLARPDLVEEPETGYGHPHGVAMEAALLYDIGWTPFCGNGRLDPGEACDDGAANNDVTPGACRSTCQRTICGDSVKEAPEECDNGAANSDTAPDACRTTCRRAACGDGAKDAAEECDNGAANSDTAPGACRSTCKNATCGDGIKDNAEECDSGAANSDTAPDACRSTCKKAACGDGIKDAGEACDQGAMNGAMTATCTATCTAKTTTITTTPPPKSGCGCSAAGGRGEAALLSSLAFLALALMTRRPRRAGG